MARDDLNFLEFLQGFRRGAVVQELDDHQAKILAAMMEIDGNGSLTMKVNYSRGKSGQLEVTVKVSSSIPQRALGKGIFFLTHDARLTRRDPHQMDIEDEIARRRSIDD